MSGFSLDAYRGINTVRIYDTTSDSDKPIFEAYLSGGHNFNISVSSEGMFSGMLGQGNPVTKALGFLEDSGLKDMALNELSSHLPGGKNNNIYKALHSNLTAVDVENKLKYRGTAPIAFSLNCFMVLKEDNSFEDITKQLSELIKKFIPKRGQIELTSTIQSLVNEADQDAKENAENYHELAWSIAQKLVKGAANYFGKIYTLNMEDTIFYKSKGNGEGVQKSLCIKIGPLTYKEMYIDNVGISVPQMYYVDEEGNGYPSQLNITLSCKSLRNATYNYINDIFK